MLRECCEHVDLDLLIDSVQPVITKIKNNSDEEFCIDNIRYDLQK